MDDFEELVKIALSHGMCRTEAVAWAENVQKEDQKIAEECMKEIPQQDGRYVPLRHLLRELEGRILREDSDC